MHPAAQWGYPVAMNTLHLAAAASDAAIGVVLAFIGGLVIAGALIWAVRFGIKKRRGEPGPPSPESQPRRPGTPDAEERQQHREPNEMPYVTDNNERLSPHELGSGSRRSDSTDTGKRPRWNSGSGGSFGSGGPGGT